MGEIMTRRRTSTYGVILLLFLSATAFSRTGQKGGKNESEQLIKGARTLESKPLAKEAKDMRRWAIEWIIATDKVSVKACSLLISGIDKKYKYGTEIFGQYTIGMAAFKLENPDKATDEDAAQLAGIESALVSYESIIKEQPKATNAFLDDLIAKRGQGELAKFAKENNCKDHK
jgi:hypothetical protein